MLLERDKPWSAQRQPIIDERVRGRLRELSNRLGDAEWLDGAFSAGDLLMVTVLRRLSGSPAYQRAFAAQLAVFADLG